jgi:transcriptional regulator with XRE-family HTH domain
LPIGSIRNYEQGQREPYWSVVFRLARALGVSVEVFAECVSKDEETPPTQASAPSTPSGEDLQAEAATHPTRQYRLKKPAAKKPPAQRGQRKRAAERGHSD